MAERIGEDIKAVFFDHDDTLVGTIEPKWAHHKFVAKKYYGKDLKDEEIIPHWGKPFPELVCVLYGTDNTEEAITNNAAHHTEFPKILFDSSIPLLRHLHEIGKLTGIITATSRFSFDHDLTLHRFPRECIDYTQTADDTTFHKPDPRVFEPALKWLETRNIKPDEVIYIADGIQDMKAALGAGFHFIGVQTGLARATEFSDLGVSSVSTIAEIHSLID